MQQGQGARQFAGKLLNIFTGSVLTDLLDIGYQTGLLEAAAQGPGTSQELSQRAGLQERYVREWLGAMVTGGVFTYDPVSRSYALPAAHAAFLTGDSASNLAPYSRLLNNLGKRLPQLVECFRNGGGVPYSEFRPDFTADMDASWRRIYDQQLISGFLGAARGLQ